MALPTEQSFIDSAQEQLGCQFPTWLNDRLLQENGGSVWAFDDEWQLYSVLDNRDSRHLKRSSTTILQETNTAKQWDGFPDNAVAIAGNGTGDLLILLPKDSHQLGDEVYLWHHDDNDLELADIELN